MLRPFTGAALLLDGKDLPRLHLVYGLTPIAVAFLAEQLSCCRRSRSSTTRSGSGADVGLPEIRAARVRQAVLRASSA